MSTSVRRQRHDLPDQSLDTRTRTTLISSDRVPFLELKKTEPFKQSESVPTLPTFKIPMLALDKLPCLQGWGSVERPPLFEKEAALEKDAARGASDAEILSRRSINSSRASQVSDVSLPTCLNLFYEKTPRAEDFGKIEWFTESCSQDSGKFGCVIKKGDNAVKVCKRRNLCENKREISILTLLASAGGHPNLPTLKWLDETEEEDHTDRKALLVFKRILGGTAEAMINFYVERLALKPSVPCVPIDIIYKLMTDLLRALDHVHSMNVVHSDLKSDNVMFDVRTGNWILIDFGAARLVSDSVSVGKHAGAVFTRPPEAGNNGPFGEPADIWALGLLFVMLLSGSSIYENLGDQTIDGLIVVFINCRCSEWITKIMNKSKIYDLYQNLPGEFQVLLNGLLEGDPAKRFTARQCSQFLLEHSSVEFPEASESVN